MAVVVATNDVDFTAVTYSRRSTAPTIHRDYTVGGPGFRHSIKHMHVRYIGLIRVWPCESSNKVDLGTHNDWLEMMDFQRCRTDDSPGSSRRVIHFDRA